MATVMKLLRGSCYRSYCTPSTAQAPLLVGRSSLRSQWSKIRQSERAISTSPRPSNRLPSKARQIPTFTANYASKRSRGFHESPRSRNGYDSGGNSSGSPAFGNVLVYGFAATSVGIWYWHEFVLKKNDTGSVKSGWGRGTAVKRGFTLEDFNKHFVCSLQNIREGRYYTLVTSSFTHFETWHLFANMVTLVSFGPSIVAYYGAANFLALYFGSAIACSSASLYFMRERERKRVFRVVEQGIGASGAVLGMTTALACSMPRYSILLFIVPMPLGAAAAGMAVFSLAAIREGWAPFVDHYGHLGGMAFGALWWLVALRRRGVRRRPF